MLRRVSWVLSCRSVSRSGSSMSLSSSVIGAEVRRLRRLDAGLADGEVRLAPLRARVLAIGGAVADGLGAVCDQLLVVELHAVGGLVLDAVPQRLELLAVQHRLPGLHRLALVGVLDLQPAGQLARGSP